MGDITISQEELDKKIADASKAAVEEYQVKVAKPEIDKLNAKNTELVEERKKDGEKLDQVKGVSVEALTFMKSDDGQKILDKIGKSDPKTIMQGIDLAKRLKDNGELDDKADIGSLVKAEVAQEIAIYDKKQQAELDAANKKVEEAEAKAKAATASFNSGKITTNLNAAMLEAKALPNATQDFIKAEIALGRLRVNEETGAFEILDDKGEVVPTKIPAKHGQPMDFEEYAKELVAEKPWLFGKTTGGNAAGGEGEGDPKDPDFDPLTSENPAKLAEWAKNNPIEHQKLLDSGQL